MPSIARSCLPYTGPRMFAAILGVVLLLPAPAGAQGPPPPIPRVAVDLHGSFLSFPNEQQLADSRGLSPSELPGLGLGGDVGAHVYPFKWRAVTFGLGGRLTVVSASQTPPPDQTTLRAVSERFTSIAPEISFNFGTGLGWSYLSGGLSSATWSIVPDGSAGQPVDDERIKTVNYGGGARWFMKRHLAFSFDVRFHAMNPGQAGTLPASPRTTLLVIGAGVSLK